VTDIYLGNYTMNIAALMAAGVDVWLKHTPVTLRGEWHEATFNDVVNFSIPAGGQSFSGQMRRWTLPNSGTGHFGTSTANPSA